MNEFTAQVFAVWQSLPLGVSAGITLVGGFLGALLVRVLIGGLLGVLRFDKLGERTGFAEFLRKGGVTYTPSRLVSLLVFWAVFTTVLVFLSRLLDIQVVASFMARIGDTVPSMLAALAITLIGVLVVTFVSNFVRTIMRNAGSGHAEIIARVVKYCGVTLILLIALEELNIGKGVLNTLVLVLAAGAVLAVALAFGLGCKDLARDWLQRTLSELQERRRESRPDMED